MDAPCSLPQRSEGFIKSSRISFKVFCFLCHYFWTACRLYFVAMSLYFLFNSHFSFLLLLAYCLTYFLLNLIAVFHLGIQYGTSDFLNFVVLVGICFSMMVSNRVFQKWYLSSRVSKVFMLFHGAQATSSLNLSMSKDLVLVKVTFFSLVLRHHCFHDSVHKVVINSIWV